MIASALLLFILAVVASAAANIRDGGLLMPAKSRLWWVVLALHVGWIGCLVAVAWRYLP